MEVSVESRPRERSFGKVVNAKDRDEELALFLEMRRREKDKEKNAGFLLLPGKNADELDAMADCDNNGGSAVVARIVGSAAPPQRKSRVDEFLNSENEKSDYDWLITPPATPLFPNLDMEAQKTATNQIEDANANVSAPKSRLASNNIASKNPTLASGLNSSSTANRRPSSSGEPTAGTRRSSTPTGRSTILSSTKPSRSSTPNSRATLSSIKPVAPPVRSSTPSSKPEGPPVRSSTPSRPTRSSTPISRSSLPASKSASRSTTPTQRPTSSSAPALSASPGQSSSASKSRSTSAKNPVPSRGSSPTVKPRPSKSSEIPGFSHDAPPNLRTLVPQRPASASKERPGAPHRPESASRDRPGAPHRPASASRDRPGAPHRPASASRDRPGAPSVGPSSVVPSSNGKPRQQACSPSRGRVSHASTTNNGNPYRVISRSSSNDSDDVNPVLLGTQSVERVVNMRKLAPPKQDDQYTVHNNSAGKSLSSESTGFGRSLSKKSFDMAMRHMDIRRTMPGNVRTGLTNIPASSVYSVRTRSTKVNTTTATDSPLSNASSEQSVNNIPVGFERCEIEDVDLGSEKGYSYSSSQQGR